MSRFSRRSLILLAGAGGAAALFLLPRTVSKIAPTSLETPGSKNIADRYSSGGGSATHMPGVATRRGSAEHQDSGQVGGGGIALKDHHTDQKVGEPGPLGKAWNQAHYGNDKGK